MKKYMNNILIILLMSVCTLSAQVGLKQGDIVYIKKQSENLRLSPNGTIISAIPQGTKVTVIGQEGKWVAIQLVGWIWGPSLIKDKDQIQGYTMKALHILVKTEQEAKEIKQLLTNGSDFQTLAKERSIGPSAKKGGDLGVINKGDLLPELDSAIRKLKTGQISAVLKSAIGYHIFKRIE